MNMIDDDAHPDEGSIHALLDGALSGIERSRIEAHVAKCETCRARVAEARGLMAGASRVIASLDETPTKVLQVAPTIRPAEPRPLWRILRVTPARSAIAALLIVAVGVVLTQKRVAVDSTVVPGVSAIAKTQEGVSPGAPTDTLLRAAIVEKLKREQPAPVLSNAHGVNVPVSPPALSATIDEIAPRQVAAARSSIAAQRDTTVAADRARVGFAPPAAGGNETPSQRLGVAAKAAESAGAAAKDRADASAVSMAGSCIRIETTIPGGGTWGTASLPVMLAFDSAGKVAHVLGANGAATEALTVATAISSDSMMLRLRRIGYEGFMRLGPGSDSRAGFLHSAESQAQLNEVVVTAENDSGSRGRLEKRVAVAAPAPARTSVPSTAQIPITARRVSCPPR
jgi:hypothetical protein